MSVFSAARNAHRRLAVALRALATALGMLLCASLPQSAFASPADVSSVQSEAAPQAQVEEPTERAAATGDATQTAQGTATDLQAQDPQATGEPPAVAQVPPASEPVPPRDRPEAVIKVILALLALMALAYLGGHRRVLELERKLGISQVITAGLPFLVLGMVARLPSIGVLTDPVLVELRPVLLMGLGSVGFVAGFRFEAKLFQGLPPGTSGIALLSTLMPTAMVALATAPLLLHFAGVAWSDCLDDPVLLRDALILATAGATTARSAVRLIDTSGGEGIAARIIRIEELAGVLGLALVAAFFRQEGVSQGWNLPGVAWLLLTLGLGTTLGLLFYTILVTTPRGPDFLAVTLGAIAFAAGAAGQLQLSSVAVAFVAGVILANFPGTYQTRLREMLKRIERPIYLLALFLIGAQWDATDWRGWVLMPVFMVARLVGKWLAARLAARHERMPITAEESRTLMISPIGALAIAIVVNAQLLYPGGSISLVVSAVIGGGVLTEAFVQLATRRRARRLRLAAHGAAEAGKGPR